MAATLYLERARVLRKDIMAMVTRVLVWPLSNWFYDIFTGITTRTARCGLLLEGLRLSTLKQDGHGGREDLRGSGRRSIIPYVHGELLYCCVCCSTLRLNLPKSLRAPI
jgi:hypothetical protein